VKAPPFAYARAGSLEEALALLAEAGEDAKAIAGGQSLVPLLAYRLVRPSHLVDIDGIAGLGGIEEDGAGGLAIGALARHAQLAALEGGGARGLLGQAASLIGHVPIRSRGTLGGSLAHADPAAELPVALLALDATVVVRSPGGEREIPIDGFATGPFQTVLTPGELVTGARVPPRAGARVAFRELAVRSGDFALAIAAVVVDVEEGALRRVRVALGGVDPVPRRSVEAERLLEGAAPGDEAIEAAAEAAAAGCDPVADHVTSAAYRRDLVRRLVRDALREVHAEAA